MNTVTAAHFARMCNVSREAIRKAIKAENIKATGVGRKCVIQVDHRITQEYLRGKNPDAATAEPVEQEPAPAPKPKKQPAKKKPAPPIDPKLEITAPEVPDNTPPDYGINSLDDVTNKNIGLVDKIQLQKFKIYEDALKVRQEREAKRGDLIPRLMVKHIFAKLYSIHINEFKTMEDRLTPDICAIFGVQDSSPEAVKVRQLLNTDQGKTLRSIQRLFNDFLAKIKAKKL